MYFVFYGKHSTWLQITFGRLLLLKCMQSAFDDVLTHLPTSTTNATIVTCFH